MRNAQHDGSPSIVSTRKMQTSRSYSHDLRSHVDSNSNLSISKSAHSSTSNSRTNLTMPDISPSNSQFFEVMYVGKIKVSHKRVPFSFIDDALPKFKAYDTQRIKLQSQILQKVRFSLFFSNQTRWYLKGAKGDSHKVSLSFKCNFLVKWSIYAERLDYIANADLNAIELQENEEPEVRPGKSTDGRRNSNGSVSFAPRSPSTSQLKITEENEEDENDQDDDETGSKGSKESFTEKVIDTKYSDNDKDASTSYMKNQILRRKSVAPAVLHE